MDILSFLLASAFIFAWGFAMILGTVAVFGFAVVALNWALDFEGER